MCFFSGNGSTKACLRLKGFQVDMKQSIKLIHLLANRTIASKAKITNVKLSQKKKEKASLLYQRWHHLKLQAVA